MSHGWSLENSDLSPALRFLVNRYRRVKTAFKGCMLLSGEEIIALGGPGMKELNNILDMNNETHFLI